MRSLTFLSPRKFGLQIPAPVTELSALRRLKLLRIASKQFAPLLLPQGFASLAGTLNELVLESADWPAIPQVCVLREASCVYTASYPLICACLTLERSPKTKGGGGGGGPADRM